MFLFGVQILDIRIGSKITLKSASKLNAIKHNTNQLAIALMNFDNLLHFDLMTGLIC